MDYLYQIDVVIFRWFNSWAGISAFFDWLIVFRAVRLWYLVMAAVSIIAVSGVFPRFRQYLRRNIEFFFLAFISAFSARFVFTEIIRYFLARPRPFEVLDGVTRLVDNVHKIFGNGSSSSFPSGHAALAFATAASVYFYYPKSSILFFFAALSIGFGRIAAGVHWPSDILGGAIVGMGAAVLVRFVWKKFF